MSGDLSADADALPPTIADRVDRICDQFEAAWQAGGRARIEAFLSAAPEPDRPALLRELLDLELDLRRGGGERPSVQEYRDRFPGHAELIRSAFEVRDPPATADPHPPPGRFPAPSAAAGPPPAAGYEILGELGRGGMGVVYRAYDRKRDEMVALKTVHQLGPAALYRFKREFRALADVHHPNLVSLYELTSDGQSWFFTMELVEGIDFLTFSRAPIDETDAETEKDLSASDMGPLGASTVVQDVVADLVLTDPEPGGASSRARPDSPSSLSPSQLSRLREALGQLAQGVVALHEAGRLHRDIKPTNVLVTRRGRVVLLDFGLAAELEPTGLHQSSEPQILGTAAYMAPEQAAGLSVSPASDWYSVGAMLFEALTGRRPFLGRPLEVLMDKQNYEPPPPRELVPDVPEDLNALCVELLRRDPQARPSGEEVLHRLGAASKDMPRLGTQRRPFVGREAQLAALGEAFAAVRRGRTVAVFVHGCSGVGKSALMRRFLEGLTEGDEAVVLAGRCYEQESVAYKALDTLIDALIRYLRRLSRREADVLMPRDLPALARVFPVLRRVEAVAEAPQRTHAILDQQELRRRAFAALRELLARIGDRRPLVLAIDDLQWGDVDSASLLSDLLRPPDPPALLLVGAYRSEDAAVSPCLRKLLGPSEEDAVLWDRREVAVAALSPSEGRALALALIGQDDEAARRLAETIVRETGGSPYFVYELVQYLRDGGELGESLAALSSDVSLDEVLWRRIQRLPDEAQHLLEVLAVAGQPIRQAMACRIAELGAEGFSGLALLRSHRLIRGTGPGSLDDVETYHDRIRETVVNHLPAERRRGWHRGLAQALEAAGGADPETLAVHFEEVGDAEKAGHYYGQAADKASAALAFDRAAKLYRRALELRPARDAEGRRRRIGLGDALANAGRGGAAAHAYQDASAGAEATERLELQRRAAYQFLISGHIDEGLSAFSAILDRIGMPLPSTPRRALLRLLFSRARLRLRGLGFRERDAAQIAPEQLELVDIARSVAVGMSLVDVIRGSGYQTHSLLLALRAGEPFRIALALGCEAVYSAFQGRPTRHRTARLITAAEALAQQLGHPHALGMASLAAGAAEYLEGRFRTALEPLDRAEAILRGQCIGVGWELDTARICGLWSLFFLGRLAELGDRSRVIFHEARERGDRYMEATPGPFVGAVVRLAADDVEGARTLAREALGRWSQRGFHVQHLNFYRGNLYADLYAGDVARAWRRVTETAPVLSSSLLLRIQQVRADVLQHGGRCAIAMAATAADPKRLLHQAEDYARRLDRERLPWTAAVARLIRAGAASVRRDPDGAVRFLTVAAEGFEASGMELFAAATRRQLGRLLGGDEGRTLIARADTWMAGQAIRSPDRMTACLAPGFEKIP